MKRVKSKGVEVIVANRMTYLPVTRAIEDIEIDLRQARKVKLPFSALGASPDS